MKKLCVLLAVALMLSLATPAFAFVDVPEGHWAEEYLEKIADVGIVIGFPDGTFRGAENLTRYQAATMTARMMDWVNETVEAALADVDFDDEELKLDIRNLRSDLMVLMGEHFDLEFMVLQMQDDMEALDAKIAEVAAQMDATEDELKAYVDQTTRALRAELQRQGLTDQQAEDVMIMIRALTREFRDDIDAIWAELEKEPQLSFSIDADFDISSYKRISGDGTLFENPFYHRTSDRWRANILVPEGASYTYDLTLGIHGRTDLVDMDLSMDLFKDGVWMFDAPYWIPFESLTGTLTTPIFEVLLTDNYEVSPTGYIEVEDRGAIVTHDKGSLSFIFSDVVGLEEVVPTDILGDDIDFYFIGDYTAQPLEMLTSTFTFGTLNFDDQYVLGMKHVASIDPLTLTLDTAVSETGLFEDEELAYFATVKADAELGLLSLGVDYTLGLEEFTPLGDGSQPQGGLGVSAEALIGILALEAWYTDKHDLGVPTAGIVNRVGGSAGLDEALTFGPMELDALVEYTYDLETEAMHYDLRDVSLGTGTDVFDFTVNYFHRKGPGRPFVFSWVAQGNVQVGEAHNVNASLNLYPIEMLEISAGARYNLLSTETRDMPVDLDGSLTLTPFQWLTLGAEADYAFETTDPLTASVHADVAPDPYGLLGFDVAPSAGVWYGITHEALNYNVGLTLSREVLANLDWVNAAKYDYRELNPHPVGYDDGTWIELSTGFDYAGIANFDLIWGKYNSITDADDDYTYKGLEAGIGVSF